MDFQLYELYKLVPLIKLPPQSLNENCEGRAPKLGCRAQIFLASPARGASEPKELKYARSSVKALSNS